MGGILHLVRDRLSCCFFSIVQQCEPVSPSISRGVLGPHLHALQGFQGQNLSCQTSVTHDLLAHLLSLFVFPFLFKTFTYYLFKGLFVFFVLCM